MIEAAIVERLKADTDFDGLSQGRLYPVTATDPVYPLVLYRSSVDDDIAASGPTGQRMAEILFESHAFLYSAAKALDDSIRVSLNGFRGTLGAYSVRSIIASESRDSGGYRNDGGGNHVYIVTRSVRVVYE